LHGEAVAGLSETTAASVDRVARPEEMAELDRSLPDLREGREGKWKPSALFRENEGAIR
jgi:hypothetical protein